MITPSLQEKVSTPFHSMYIHVEYKEDGTVCGGGISDPHKDGDAQISQLVAALGGGLHRILSQEPLRIEPNGARLTQDDYLTIAKIFYPDTQMPDFTLPAGDHPLAHASRMQWRLDRAEEAVFAIVEMINSKQENGT